MGASDEGGLDERTLPDVLRSFALLLSDDHSAGDILLQLGESMTALLPVDGVGVLLRDREHSGMVVATANTDPGLIVERLETELGEGPCTTSMETGQQITEPDLAAAQERYPRFVPRAMEAGVRSIHALPLTVRLEQVGSVDVIAYRPVTLTADHLATAQVLADVSVSYLANRRVLDQSNETARQLQQALDTRIVIEQAKGKLSERHGIPVREAFERLRRHARNRGEKVHAVAAAVVEGDLEV